LVDKADRLKQWSGFLGPFLIIPSQLSPWHSVQNLGAEIQGFAYKLIRCKHQNPFPLNLWPMCASQFDPSIHPHICLLHPPNHVTQFSLMFSSILYAFLPTRLLLSAPTKKSLSPSSQTNHGET
jgi:hypothetical protein